MVHNQKLNVLLLVDSLPNPEDPDPYFHFKNIFVSRPMLSLARKHRVAWPLFRPFAAGLTAGLNTLRGANVHFPVLFRQAGQIQVSELRYVHLPRLYPALKSRTLNDFIHGQRQGFDLIHCHSAYDLGLAGLAARERFGLPLVVTVYGTDVNWLFEEGNRRASRRIARDTRRVLLGADRVICVSRDLLDKVESLGVPRDSLRWIPNGVDSDLFYPGDRQAARASLGWPQQGRIVLFVGNLIPTKGVIELIEAMADLTAGPEKEDIRLVLAGPLGKSGDELKEAIKAHGLEQRVVLTGTVAPDNVPGLMRACDIFCLPSWREGWPLSVIEAMACGRPVVATKVGGIPEIVDGPDLGVLCQPRAPRALAVALDEALERQWDPELISRAAARYAYDTLCPRIESVYRELTAEG